MPGAGESRRWKVAQAPLLFAESAFIKLPPNQIEIWGKAWRRSIPCSLGGLAAVCVFRLKNWHILGGQSKRQDASRENAE